MRGGGGAAAARVLPARLLAAVVLAACTLKDPAREAAADSAHARRAAAAAVAAVLDDTTAPARTADGGIATATSAELAALRRELAPPLAGVRPERMPDSYADARGTRVHQALDIMAPRGTPIHAAARGRVLRMFTSKAGGLMVYAADPSERFVLMYAHLDTYAPGLREGATLARGDVLGTVGSSGNASPDAPHLHFAIARVADVARWWTGTPVNPWPLLQP